jgi:nitroreductase
MHAGFPQDHPSRAEDFTMLRELVLKTRSCRRFDQGEPVSTEALRELVDLARHSASGGNVQPLKYMLFNDPEQNARLFPFLAWAGYLKEWPGPAEGERPSAYVVIFCDKNISKGPGCDHGIAAQSIMLGATEKGLGGCMIGAIDRKGMRQALRIPEHLEISLVLAIGKTKETVKVEPVGPDGDIKYWRDENDVHHVPKRALDDLIV